MRVIPKTQAAQANLWAAQGDEFEKYCEAINFELLTGSGHDVRAQERQALRPPRSRRGGVADVRGLNAYRHRAAVAGTAVRCVS